MKMRNDIRAKRAFLGTGLHFPITVDRITGQIRESAHEENIKESIFLILMTKKGERVMRPDFGCDIHQFMFDAVDYTVRMRMKRAVEEALIRWEPRITDIEVEILDSASAGDALQIRIRYRVRATNNPFNLVFPFYLQEQ